VKTVVQLSSKVFAADLLQMQQTEFANSIGDCGSQGIYWTAEDRSPS
jgi:hypothetical protein